MFAGWAANSRYLARTTDQHYGDDEWGEFTPSAKLSWMLAEETMLYAGYSTGFKSGGFSTVSGFLRPYDPETLDSYTLGLKTTLADSLRLNAEVFYNDYQDKQLSTVMLDENGRLVALEDNVGEMSTSGAEIEVEWAPLEGLLLMVSGGYLDTDVDAYVLQDAAGNDLWTSRSRRPWVSRPSGPRRRALSTASRSPTWGMLRWAPMCRTVTSRTPTRRSTSVTRSP